MKTIRRSSDRGHANHGWLDAYHTFSFADYHDESQMGFRVLRVINQDTIAGGGGFATHGHRDMEIITYILSGALEHKDTLGNSAVIWPGEVQHMSAGTGIRHSEFNHYQDQNTQLLQIWVLPDKTGHSPGYGQKSFANEMKAKDLVLVASGSGAESSLPVHQDLQLYIGHPRSPINYLIKPSRHLWIQVSKGQIDVDDQALEFGDGMAISEEPSVKIIGGPEAEFLLFDLP